MLQPWVIKCEVDHLSIGEGFGPNVTAHDGDLELDPLNGSIAIRIELLQHILDLALGQTLLFTHKISPLTPLTSRILLSYHISAQVSRD